MRLKDAMLAALRSYLALGLVSYAHVNLAARKLMQKTAPEFLEWAEELTVGEKHNKKTLHLDFIAQYPDFGEGKKKIGQGTLTSWVKSYAASKSLEVASKLLEVVETKSGSERFLTLIWTRSGDLDAGRTPPETPVVLRKVPE